MSSPSPSMSPVESTQELTSLRTMLFPTQGVDSHNEGSVVKHVRSVTVHVARPIDFHKACEQGKCDQNMSSASSSISPVKSTSTRPLSVSLSVASPSELVEPLLISCCDSS
eukprot:2198326-Amphidinium_carterae.1